MARKLSKTDKITSLIINVIRVIVCVTIVMVVARNFLHGSNNFVVIEDENSSVEEEIPVKETAFSTTEIAVSSSPSSSSSQAEISPPVSSVLPQSSIIERDNNAVSSASEQANFNKININNANAAELLKLKGIGEVKAAAIIQYRKENGGFKSVDELINVSGIGKKTLEKIRDYVTV